MLVCVEKGVLHVQLCWESAKDVVEDLEECEEAAGHAWLAGVISQGWWV